MKILLISGHGAGDSGAVGCGYKEADLTRKATTLLKKYLDSYGVVTTRYSESRNAYEDNKNGNLQYSFKNFNLVIEVHFNSYNGNAYGVEVLYRPSGTKALASKVSSAIASFGFYNRGAKQRTDLMNMNTCYRQDVPYILIETAFIDNKSDMARYNKDVSAIWSKVADALADYYGIKKTSQNVNKPVTSTSKPATQTSTAKKSEKIDVDGSWGKDTTKLSQKVLGTTVDGIVSNQPMSNRQYLTNCSMTSWEFKYSGYSAGSSMVRALQKLIGAKVDGYFGKESVKKLQKFLGIKVDGYCGFNTVSAWQKYLNSKVK